MEKHLFRPDRNQMDVGRRWRTKKQKQKRKKRNTVRKKAAGEEGHFQEAITSPHQDQHVLLRVVGKQQGMALAHRTRGWGPLRGADFGNSGSAWPAGTPRGHQH